MADIPDSDWVGRVLHGPAGYDLGGELPESSILLEIVNATKAADIVIPAYKNRWGHPVAFHRRYLSALQNCRGDQGARELLKRETNSRVILNINDPGIVRDIDVVADLLKT